MPLEPSAPPDARTPIPSCPVAYAAGYDVLLPVLLHRSPELGLGGQESS